MASLDHHLNPLFSIKECMSCGALYTRNCGCSKGGLEDKILVPKPPQNCAICGDPVDGFICRSWAFYAKVLNTVVRRPKRSHLDEPIRRARRPSNHGEKELSTIPEKDKSSVENLDPIPSGSKGVSDDICDNDHSDAKSLLSQDISITSPKINFLSEEFAGEFVPIPPGMDEDEFDEEEDDCYNTTSDDDSYGNIEYVEASSLNLEYDSLEEENEDQEEKEFDLEDIFQIQDVILREKLLNVHRLITNIESLKNNPTPDFVFKSPSSFPIPVVI
ncbi:hypothetical protein Tco_0686765 [Tanacetum coccineum]